MDNLKNWKEITKGLYRYVIGCDVAYEIHIIYWAHDTDILTAKANLYIVGEWNNGGSYTTERECLLTENPICQCIKKAIEDNKENNC